MKRLYPLEALHRIRMNREKAAMTRLGLARVAEQSAVDALRSREREHREYLSWCETEADRIMEKLLGGGITRGELETAKAQIAWNRDGEEAYLERISSAKSALESARKELKEAAELHQKAYLSLEKIKAHRSEWSSKLVLAQEAADEAELQEVAELLHQRVEARHAA